MCFAFEYENGWKWWKIIHHEYYNKGCVVVDAIMNGVALSS